MTARNGCTNSRQGFVPPWAAALVSLLLTLLACPPLVAQKVDRDELVNIAVEAYLYAYPAVLMEITRQLGTNCESPVVENLCAPMNQFVHAATFPDATFTDVVRPNADTLYSSLWFDVAEEPLVIQVPDSGGRYYLLPMLDLWTDVFASPGKRTTGTAAQTFAIVGPNWDGELPQDMGMIRSPTAVGWMIGRTQTNGPADFASVNRFQAGLKAVPLSSWGRAYTPPKGEVNAGISATPPVDQVAEMDAAAFFTRFAQLTKHNPPHANDYPVLARMKRIGLEAGVPFDFDKASPQLQQALRKAVPLAQKWIAAGITTAANQVNNWSMVMPPIGTYGTAYLRRAEIAYAGLGANVVRDAIYPFAAMDADGQPFDSGKKYVLHFRKDQIPPVRAFWSLTMYNDKQFFADNPLNRYALGDRDELKYGADGSLTLYIQRDSPGKDRESNWLPAPESGDFSMNLRLYWPEIDALSGSWKPPKVKSVE
ncbi:DUF1254 domain-containing protein [Microbulbifer sp. TYP-18]|uniref:DUF1254 domain-containing protein n=1 Tax=Microbulbifer sp. TYP-18 TaxID=3230024 RepID=UPI0034C5E465